MSRVPIDEDDQEQFNYRIKDTIVMSKFMELDKKYFYLNRTSLVGTCVNFLNQSYQASSHNSFSSYGGGEKFIEIRLSDKLASLPNYKVTDVNYNEAETLKGKKWGLNSFIRNSPKWVDNSYYVKLGDVTPISENEKYH